MFLSNLKLTNFRNFSKLGLDFAKITLLLGDNAQGKSNFLESIYFLAITKSSRVEKDVQLIKDGEEFARVEGKIGESESVYQYISGSEKTDLPAARLPAGQGRQGTPVTTLEVVMVRKPETESLCVEKRVKVNGVSKRVIDYLGGLVVIYFAPEDINLVTGAPSLRRYHLDLTLAQIDRHYKKATADYAIALTSRNRLLKKIKEGLAKPVELEFWTSQLVTCGQVITQKREEFFTKIEELLSSYSVPKNSLGNFKFVYKKSIINAERIFQYQGREIAAGTTLIGPHRDDFTFEMDGKSLAFFGSRGEQRTAVLELKLAELKFVTATCQIVPILLLDDVFSELDERHREYVMEVALGQQTILSAVEERQVPKEFLKKIKIVKVEKGKITTS